MIRRIVLAALLALAPLTVEAANCGGNPFTLLNGQTADATQVMANFNNLLNCANNNLAHNAANSDITSLSGLTTPLSVAQGGTGATTLLLNGVLLGNGTSALQTVAPSTSGNVLQSNGTTWVSAVGFGSVTEAPSGGINVINGTTTAVLKFFPADLAVKTTPTSADFIVIADVAASSQGKVALSPAATSATTFTGTNTNQWITPGGFGGNVTLQTTGGFFKIPGGAIIQAGSLTVGGTSQATVTLPVTCPTSLDSVAVSYNDTPTSVSLPTTGPGTGTLTTSSFVLSNGSGAPHLIGWIAFCH